MRIFTLKHRTSQCSSYSTVGVIDLGHLILWIFITKEDTISFVIDHGDAWTPIKASNIVQMWMKSVHWFQYVVHFTHVYALCTQTKPTIKMSHYSICTWNYCGHGTILAWKCQVLVCLFCKTLESDKPINLELDFTFKVFSWYKIKCTPLHFYFEIVTEISIYN